jgi:hypothetical protein
MNKCILLDLSGHAAKRSKPPHPIYPEPVFVQTFTRCNYPIRAFSLLQDIDERAGVMLSFCHSGRPGAMQNATSDPSRRPRLEAVAQAQPQPRSF